MTDIDYSGPLRRDDLDPGRPGYEPWNDPWHPDNSGRFTRIPDRQTEAREFRTLIAIVVALVVISVVVGSMMERLAQ